MRIWEKHENGNRTLNVAVVTSKNLATIYLQLNDKVSMFFVSYLHTRASQIFRNFGHTVFCVQLNDRKLMRQVWADWRSSSMVARPPKLTSPGGNFCKMLTWTGQLWRPGHHRR